MLLLLFLLLFAGISEILSDLLPTTYVSALVKGHDHIPCTSVRVVVLQLDLEGFTKLSTVMPHLALADRINALFCAFDDAVMGRDLFKLDTIGDAYILVGWLPKEEEEDNLDLHGADVQGGWDEGRRRSIEKQQAVERTCSNVLAVAEAMIHAVRMHSLDVEQPLSARIGISVGAAVAGVLGGLPRFGVFGEAMWEVAELEKAGIGQQAHCSATFLRLLTLSDDAALSAWHVAAAGEARRAAAAGEAQEQSRADPQLSPTMRDTVAEIEIGCSPSANGNWDTPDVRLQPPCAPLLGARAPAAHADAPTHRVFNVLGMYLCHEHLHLVCLRVRHSAYYW